MSATSTELALKPIAILSLLGDAPGTGAAFRTFQGRTVLAGTAERVRAATQAPDVVVLAWADQVAAAERSVGVEAVQNCGPRQASAAASLIAASLRWADGWRGGLLGVCGFDRGFDATHIVRAAEAVDANAVLLIDASAALIESAIVDAAIDHLAERPAIDFAFSPGTPGAGVMILRLEQVRDLEKKSRWPGHLLAYHPDRPVHDPLAKEYAIDVSQTLARSLANVRIDSDRQSARLSLPQVGELSAEAIVARLRTGARLDPAPRELVLELTTERATRPLFSILANGELQREPMSVERAKRIFARLAHVDDLRLTFAGVGDPLLHEQFDRILDAARDAGIGAIHIETDLLPRLADYIARLCTGDVDVVSIHLPAIHRNTYETLMGVNRVQDVLENVRQLVTTRARGSAGLPIVVPLFVKCEANLAEMEEWYDQWIRAVGAAVIRGPSDFGGAIPYAGVSDMLPPVRRGCRRLNSRMTILSDGTIASCEEDVFGQQSCGHVDRVDLLDAWTDGLQHVRNNHGCGAVCSNCRMWDRP